MAFTMRDAVSSDHEDFVRLSAELKVPDPPPTLQRFVEQIAPHAFFCVESAQPVAYALWKKYGDAAHVVHVVTAPGHRGRGLASLGVAGGRALLAVCEQDRVVGFAAFDPDFPGASPFRVACTEHARPLLEAMRSHARAERASVHLFVEDDRALTAALRTAGGNALFRILRMTGELSAATGR